MSFFMGLATGLAKSVDTQLKESIERTRDNIDMVSKWRLKKAEEREKERRTKDKEVEALIQNAAYVISGDQNDVTAQNIAASLYKERGLTGFTEDIDFIKQQKAAGVGVRPLDFIQRANVDAPTNKYSLSEIVRSLSDAESSYAPSDMIFPKGTIKGSGLIGAIAPDFDVTAAGGQRAAEQMQQIGLTTTPTAPSLSFDRYTFDREGLGYATKSVNEKLTYLRNIMDDPSADPETVAGAGQRLDELLNKSMTGEEKSAIQAINLKLSRLSTQDTSAMTEMQFKAFDDEQDALIKRRQGLEDTIALRDAKSEKERLAIQANIAFREGRIEDGYRLSAQAEDYGTQVTNATLVNRVKGRATRLQDNADYMASTGAYKGDGFKEDQTRIQVLQANEEALMGVSFDKVQAFSTQIRQAALAEFKSQHPGMYKDLNITTNEDGTVDPASFVNAITSARGNVSEKYNEILNSVIQRYKTIGAKHNVSEDTIDSAVMLLTGKGLPAVTDDGATGTGTGQTDAAFSLDPTVPGPELDFDMPTDEVMEAELAAKLSSEEVLSLETKYPNDASGATSIFSDLAAQGQSVDEIVAGVSDIHDESFATEVKNVADAVETVVSNAVKDNAIPDITSVGADVQLSGARKSGVVKQVADELNISAEAASSLIDREVEKINAPISMSASEATPNNVMKVLDKEGFIALGGGVAPLRYEKATLAIADAFNMNPADAEVALDNAMNMVRQQRRAAADPEFAEKFRRSTLLGQIDRVKFKPENILTDAFKDVPEDSSGAEPAKFKPSAIQLAMKFIDGTLEGAERSAFKKELTGPNGKQLAAAIQMIRDRRKAEKEVSAYRSRGGLMGR